MKFSLKGYDNKNEEIALPPILWYEQTTKRLGFEETFLVCFSQNVPFSLTKVIVTKENKKKSECFVDHIELEANKLGFFCRVKLKNIVCRLFENQVKPTVHNKFTLEEMLEKYAKSYNLKCNIEKADEIEIDNFYVDMGMTALDVIELFFRATFKKSVYLTENNSLTFPFSPKTPLYFSNYENNKTNNINKIKYNYLKMLDNRAFLISDAYIKIDYNDVDVNDFEFLNLPEKNIYATGCNIERVKFFNLPKQWQLLPKDCLQYMVKKENTKRFLYEISTFEKLNISPGIIAKIEEIDPTRSFLISEIKKIYDENARETKIFLTNIAN